MPASSILPAASPSIASGPGSRTPRLEPPAVKLAYIMSRFPKITETFVLYEILELRRLGMEVEIYPLIRESSSAEHPEVAEVMDSVRFQPFLSGPILLANLWFLLRRPRAYLKVLASIL